MRSFNSITENETYIKNDLLQVSQKEIKRLTKNKANLTEIIPDMIFIINDEYLIENMNKSAIRQFGDLRGKKCFKAIFGSTKNCTVCYCPIDQPADEAPYGEIAEKQVGNSWYEYLHVPLEGYKGDKLVMMIMRDVTLKKQYEQNLVEYNEDIENLLLDRISFMELSETKRQKLANEVNVLKKEFNTLKTTNKMIGSSKGIKEIRSMIDQVADSDATILITGESGTGKELVSDLIHQQSSRSKGPYLKFNCAAVSENLLESDLFGYEQGAFTGATHKRKGKFEIANGGTIFLDEIGDISPKMQASLLRVLQNGEIIRVGGAVPVSINVRVIAATNADLAAAVKKGSFRKDLYYRLNVINLHLPPLRERKNDITPLTVHFLDKYKKAFRKNINFLPESIMETLLQYTWPGNIRELENIIQRAVLLAKDDSISIDDLDPKLNMFPTENSTTIAFNSSLLEKPLNDSISFYEEKIIMAALDKLNGNTLEVAKTLQISKTSLYDKMKRYNISAKKFKA